jgi:type IV pilus assembly protein PilM
MGFSLSALTSLLKTSTTPSAQSGVLGIDIGTSTIKVVQLKDVKGVPTLEKYGEIQLGPYEGVSLGMGTHLPTQKLVEALIDILKESEVTSAYAHYAIPYSACFITPVSVATTDQAQIGAMVPLEARKFIPVPLTKVTLSWFPLFAHPTEQRTDVLVTAIANDVLTRYNLIMTSAGLTAASSEIEVFSSMRSILSPDDDVVAVIDLGTSSTRMCIVKRGIVTKTHSIVLSGAELTKALADELKIGFDEAELKKRESGMSMTMAEEVVRKTLTRVLSRGMRELHTVVSRYEKDDTSTVSKIFVTGGGAGMPGLLPYMHDLFAKPVVLAEPFSKVAYPAFLQDTLKEIGPVFSVALGIALRAFEVKN